MLTSPASWVLCEWHTDFICAGDEGVPPHCLVSVKHREPDQGPWQLSQMPSKGGLSTLYKRWDESGRQHNCRWITNAGLKPGPGIQARTLSNLLSTRNPNFRAAIIPYAEFLREGISAETLDDAVGFLESLTIFSTGGDARSFRSQVIDEAARPILQELGVRPGLARKAYEAAYGLVLEAVGGLNPEICNVAWYSESDATAFDVHRRKITRERLMQRLMDNGIAISPDRVYSQERRESTMIRKLRAGGLGPTILSSAPRIRQHWYELEVQMRPDIPSQYGDELARIRAEVALRAGEAESKHRIAGNVYGVQMHQELCRTLRRPIEGSRFGTTPTELLGCVYQMTDECEIWWSDWFDISADAPVQRAYETKPIPTPSFLQGELPFD